MKTNWTNYVRVIGSVCLLVGYFTILHGDRAMGLSVSLVGSICMLPFAISWKMWDVVVLQTVFGSITLNAMVTGTK
jgi:hypothetical protein